jgi:molecular chaperone DnaJ
LKIAVQARAFKLLDIQCNNPSDYAILGLQEGASKERIKKAYYSLSRQFHPDKYRGNDEAGATQAFSLITEAYKRLTESPNSSL